MADLSENGVDTKLSLISASMPDCVEGSKIEAGFIWKLVELAFSVVWKSRKPTQEQAAAAYSSLSHLLGKVWDRRMVIRNMMRLVANWSFIREGMEIPRWCGDRILADMVVIGVRRLDGLLFGSIPYALKLKLKTGLGAGIITWSEVSSDQLLNFLQHQSGCSSYGCAVEEIAGMKFRSDISMDQRGMSRIYGMRSTDAQKKHNRDLSERRVDPEKCQSAPMPCNVCSCKVNECPLAVWA